MVALSHTPLQLIVPHNHEETANPKTTNQFGKVENTGKLTSVNPKPPTNERKRRKRQAAMMHQKNRQPMKEKGGKVGKYNNDSASRPGKTPNPKGKMGEPYKLLQKDVRETKLLKVGS